MTREEAKAYIIRHCNPDYPKGKTEWEQAVNMAIKALEQPEPEIYWGYTPTPERPLADLEIVSRLRTIQKQIGGSYAIDRAIEIIEAVAERRTDE